MTVPGVLFLCVANSARSQIAEALARQRFGDRIRVQSAGSKPSKVNPFAVETLAEANVPVTGQTSKSADTIDASTIDLVVTLCAEEVCPVFLGAKRKLHIPIPDPASAEPLPDGEMRGRFRLARRAIHARLDAIEPMLAVPEGTSIGPAIPDDRSAIESLLRAANLPLDGLDDAFPDGFAVARIPGSIIGCAGLETWSNHALLRSVVVDPAHRGKHLANALVADRLAFAKSTAIASVSLLTTNAESYFARLGFQTIARDALPRMVTRSTQTQVSACSTAVAMHYRIYETSEEMLDRHVAEELAAHGTLVPPWQKYPELPRRSLGWRMGAGEWYLDMWRTWWKTLDDAARADYKQRWAPTAPEPWRDWLP